MDFKIDEYEKSTEEFENYVNTIPKKAPLRLSKSTTIGSLVKEYYKKLEFTEPEELSMLSSILQSLKNWGNHEKTPLKSQNKGIVSLSNRYNELSKQLININKEIKLLSELIDFKITEANSVATESEIIKAISILNSEIIKSGIKSKESEKNLLQIQELNNLVPELQTIQQLYKDIEILEGEKEVINDNLQEITKFYEDLLTKSG